MKLIILWLGWISYARGAKFFENTYSFNPLVTTAQGKLIGSTATDFRGGKYYQFQGIPYAAPPLGSLRFKAPHPPQPWNGIFNATKLGNPCIGRDILHTRLIIGSEDCLVLNVYTKNIPRPFAQTNLSPVMFWIHGGAWIFGSGGTDFFGPDFLMTQDVVVVTINYRLGLFGFLSLEEISLGVPGNAGLKDMVMALKWVQKNIKYFGGDPKAVTVFGEGTGGAAAHLLALSPMAQGLFAKAIAQSGTALNPWAIGQTGVQSIVDAANIPGANGAAVLNYFMSLTPLEIFAIQEKMHDVLIPSFHRSFGYVVEKKSSDPFLLKKPIDIMLSGHFSQVPIIFGYNSLEGLYSSLFSVNISAEQPSFFENVIPWTFDYVNNHQALEKAASEIKDFYYSNEQSNSLVQYNILTDSFFVHSIHLSTIIHARISSSPVYLYRISVESGLNTGKIIGGLILPGVCHFDDIGYLFKTYVTPQVFPPGNEQTASRRIVTLWTNFAKTGTPTPGPKDLLLNVEWSKAYDKNLSLFDIGNTLDFVPFPNETTVTFWRNLCSASATDKNIC